MAEICARVGQTREVKALVITGAGDKAFAAGTDIAQFQAFKGSEDGIAYERKIDRIVDTIERCSVPTIAAIAALHRRRAAIAAVCDQLATTSAQFGFPIARTLGNCLSMANYARLAALIGPQRTKEVIFPAKLIDGPTALSIGLRAPAGRRLHARAEEGPHGASHAPITLQVTKEALRRLQARLGDDDIDDLIRLAYGSQDFREGMAAWPSGRRNGRDLARHGRRT